MRIQTEIFIANHGDALALDHDGEDSHKWTYLDYQIEAYVHGDVNDAFIDIFVNGSEELADGCDDGIISHLADDEFDDASTLALTGLIASSEMQELVQRAVDRELAARA